MWGGPHHAFRGAGIAVGYAAVQGLPSSAEEPQEADLERTVAPSLPQADRVLSQAQGQACTHFSRFFFPFYPLLKSWSI